jgi:hypothetical protein
MQEYTKLQTILNFKTASLRDFCKHSQLRNQLKAELNTREHNAPEQKALRAYLARALRKPTYISLHFKTISEPVNGFQISNYLMLSFFSFTF